MSHTAKDMLAYQEKNFLNRTDLDVPHSKRLVGLSRKKHSEQD